MVIIVHVEPTFFDGTSQPPLLKVNFGIRYFKPKLSNVPYELKCYYSLIQTYSLMEWRIPIVGFFRDQTELGYFSSKFLSGNSFDTLTN